MLTKTIEIDHVCIKYTFTYEDAPTLYAGSFEEIPMQHAAYVKANSVIDTLPTGSYDFHDYEVMLQTLIYQILAITISKRIESPAAIDITIKQTPRKTN